MTSLICALATQLVAFGAAADTAARDVAPPKTLLVCGSADNPVSQGLAALDVPHQRATVAAYREMSPFDFDLIIWGLDESRAALRDDASVIEAFVRAGGVFLGFRSSDEDAWLPVPVRRDKAYAFGEILQPEHPIFGGPHRLGREHLTQVHGGSIYRGLFALGPGWVPLVSTGKPQDWDKSAALDDGPHYGIVELPLGKGRIVLVQMIPAYHWFHDAEGDANAAGAMLFENLVRYAIDRAPRSAADRPPRQRPADFVTSYQDLFRTPQRGDGLSLADPAWKASSEGPYSWQVDRRGVLTLTHVDTPSKAGNFIQFSRALPVPESGGPVTLRWYYSDTYCGGRERILGGAQHGQTAQENFKRRRRVASVLVDGAPVWTQDVLGLNPQPTSLRFHQAQLSLPSDRAADGIKLAVRIDDLQDSGDDPFAIDTFFGAIELIPNLSREAITAAEGTGDGFESAGTTGIRLKGNSGSYQVAHRGAAGRYAIAVCLRDEHTGQSSLRIRAGDQIAGQWTLSADDHHTYWVATPPLTLSPGTPIQIEAQRDGDETVTLFEWAIIPERLLARPAATHGEGALPTQAGRETQTSQRKTAASTTPASTTPASTPAASQPVRFSVAIAELAGAARRDEIAAQGLPFPCGCLRRPDAIRVRAPDGQSVPVQTRQIAAWPDGTAKSIVVAFPARVDAHGVAEYRVEAGAGVEPEPPAGGLTVRADDGRLTIDTGVIMATVSTRHGRIVDEIRRGERVLKAADEVWDLALEDESGRVVRTRDAAVAATQVVESGPLRALIVRTGSFVDAAGALIDYRLQLEATAGSDALRVYAQIINREDEPEVYLKRWSLDLDQAASGGRVWIDAAQTAAAAAGDVLYQHREDTLTWTGADGRRERQAGASPGYVRLDGLAVGTRWFWQRFPQAIRFSDHGVRFDFIPQAFDDRDLPTRWAERMRQTTDRYPVGGVGYPQSPGKMGLCRLARGQAFSQEILFVLDGKRTEATDADVFAALAAPLRGVASPRYTADTGVFGEFLPADSDRYPEYERGVEQTYQQILAQRKKRREYGFMSFGDCTFEWGYGPSYTYWSNEEYDHHHGYAIQYLRSGDPRWWELCEPAARHYRDVVVIHHAPPDSLQQGGPRHHNATSLWMAQDPEQYWIADHACAGASAGHSWVEGMIDYWLLTGDPWAEEVIHSLENWYCDIAENNRFGAGGQERGPGWALIAISALAKATGRPRTYNAGRIVSDWIVQWQDPIRGVVSVPISEQPSYEGGSTFMHGIVGRGLGRWYDVTGDEQVRRAVVGIAEWMTTEPMGEPGTFWYKQSPQNSRRYSPTDQCLSGLTYAYRLSGDPWFAQVAEALVARTRPNRRSICWYPQALAHLAPPVLNEQPNRVGSKEATSDDNSRAKSRRGSSSADPGVDRQ